MGLKCLIKKCLENLTVFDRFGILGDKGGKIIGIAGVTYINENPRQPVLVFEIQRLEDGKKCSIAACLLRKTKEEARKL